VFIDARDLSDASELGADVCIVGAGAAGLSLAQRLGERFDVCVLESGGFEADAATIDLSRGRVTGQSYAALETTRSRFFGGSTNCWAGYCRPLEALDMAPREWVPDSGWPIERSHLDRYYEQARRVLKLGPLPAGAWDLPRAPRPDLSGTGMRDGLFRFSVGPYRMGAALRPQFARTARVRVILHANLTRIALHRDGRGVEELEARALGGPTLRVRARSYVLATGGLENARLLLASRNVHPTGVGNAHDLVGRYFMEHPHVRYPAELLAHTPRTLRFYRYRRLQGADVRGILRPTEAWQRRARALNHAIQLRSPQAVREGEFLVALADATRSTDGGRGAPVAQRFGLILHHEQAPNPDSRVTLIEERDALEMPRLQLDWRLQAIDRDSARKACELAVQGLALARLGRIKLSEDALADAWPADLGGGFHHMGTTRMHVDPKRGVVDANCRVHGVENLYVAGSSVFPTSGAANPTLTLVALALRLGERIEQVLA
jgi:choline dehydrogenase-like flavoprotein